MKAYGILLFALALSGVAACSTDDVLDTPDEIPVRTGITALTAQAGDMWMFNPKANRGVIVEPARLDSARYEGYELMGIVVIPSSHTSDGHAIAMAAEDAGKAYWGLVGTDTDLPDFREMPSLSESPVVSKGYLPSDRFAASGALEGYYPSASSWLPSPYDEAGGANSAYSSTTGAGGRYLANPLSQNDGKSYTGVLAGYGHKGALLCLDYKTASTDRGEWYLPSLHELGYAACRVKMLNRLLRQAGKTELSISEPYLTSCEVGEDYAYFVDMSKGFVEALRKGKVKGLVRPFVRLDDIR